MRAAALGPGDYFGERALLDQAPRSATVVARTSLDVLELSADDFARLVSPTWQLRQRMERAVTLRDAVAKMPLFADLSPSERDLLVSHVREHEIEAGETIVRQGDEGRRFFVVREGHVRVLRAESGEPERVLAELGPGDFFGELALLHAAPRNATVVAITPVRVWCLDRRDFDDVLRHYLRMDTVVQAVARQRLIELETGPASVASLNIES
jgi:CRP-like cAMP-binding protein